jgi:hypothetical protein
MKRFQTQPDARAFSSERRSVFNGANMKGMQSRRLIPWNNSKLGE